MTKRIVRINKSPVELYKILKFENIASSGGEAKFMIADGLVEVNGLIETQKRKKIYPGDRIKINDRILEIQLMQDLMSAQRSCNLKTDDSNGIGYIKGIFFSKHGDMNKSITGISHMG